MSISSLKRVLLIVSILALPGCDACEETPTGPSNLALVRVEGPAEVTVGQQVSYRAFARPLGGNTDVDVSGIVQWWSSPARLTFSAGGAATGASEGQTVVTALLVDNDVEGRLTVNVVGVPVVEEPLPPPTSPTPPPTTGSLALRCTATIEIDQLAQCSAHHTVDRVESHVEADSMTSSNDLVLVNDGFFFRGVNVGVATVTATYRGLTARAQVTVIGYVDGQYNAVFTPVSNSCTFSVRAVRTGIMIIVYRNGTLEIGGGTQSYAFTYSTANPRLVSVSGVSNANGFTYAMQLVEGADGRLTGQETIGAPGCGAIYSVVLERRP